MPIRRNADLSAIVGDSRRAVGPRQQLLAIVGIASSRQSRIAGLEPSRQVRQDAHFENVCGQCADGGRYVPTRCAATAPKQTTGQLRCPPEASRRPHPRSREAFCANQASGDIACCTRGSLILSITGTQILAGTSSQNHPDRCKVGARPSLLEPRLGSRRSRRGYLPATVSVVVSGTPRVCAHSRG